MRRILPHNRFDVTSGNLRFFQDVSQEEIRDRGKDILLQPGIVPPADATADEIFNGVPSAFTIGIASGSGNTKIDIGIGTAINPEFERIQIPLDDGVQFNEEAPLFTTLFVKGTRTPFSTGRLDVPDPDPTNTKAEGDNHLTRYVFIAHLPVVRTVSLKESIPSSPDHQNDSDGTNIGVLTFPNRRKPITSKDRKVGTVFAHQFVNGYRIYVARFSEVVFDTNNGGLPLLGNSTKYPATGIDPVNSNLLNPLQNPFTDFVNAIYLGNYVWDTSSGQIFGTPVVSNANDNPTPRRVVRFRPIESAKVGDNQASPKVTTTNYVDNQRVTLQEHVAALGTGIISPINPHAAAVQDLTQGFATPDNITYQSETQSNGIFDRLQQDNSQNLTSALDCSINNADFTITNPTPGSGGFITLARGQDLDTSRTIDVTGAAKGRVELAQLSGDQSIYVNGFRIEQIKPTLTDAGLSGTAGVIPFFDSDSEGDYVCFVTPDLDNAGFGLVGKQFLGAGADPLSVIDPDRMLVAQVFFNKSAPYATDPHIQRSRFNDDEDCVDLRSSGFVKKPQISIEGFIDPLKGILALTGIHNLVRNGNFEDLATTPSIDWVIANTGTRTLAAAQVVGNAIIKNQDPGPKINFGLKLTSGGSDETLDAELDGPAPNLKPETFYTLVGWVRFLDSDNPLTLFATLNDGTSDIVPAEKQIYLKESADFQRFSLVFKTNTGVDVANAASIVRLHITNQDPTNISLTGPDLTIHLASIQLLEGDWVTAFDTAPQDGIDKAFINRSLKGLGPIKIGPVGGPYTNSLQNLSVDREISLTGSFDSITYAQAVSPAVTGTTQDVTVPADGIPVGFSVADNGSGGQQVTIMIGMSIEYIKRLSDRFALQAFTKLFVDGIGRDERFHRFEGTGIWTTDISRVATTLSWTGFLSAGDHNFIISLHGQNTDGSQIGEDNIQLFNVQRSILKT